MNVYLLFILLALLGNLALEAAVALARLRSLGKKLPTEFMDVYSAGRYRHSQRYTRATTRLDLFRSSLMTSVVILFLLAGGFNRLDLVVRGFGYGPIVTGLVYTALLVLLSSLLGLPFSIYSTFGIEERFGFNRTTPRTFILDICRTAALTVVLGGPVLALVFWFFDHGGPLAWLYCWLLIGLFILFVQFLAPVLILPLFNTFTPLPDGELRRFIVKYTRNQGFETNGIYVMDGSRRTRRPNAFFTGFGRFRKIVFFDTLMDRLSDLEIVTVLAHEMGHCKQGHILKMTGANILQMGIMLFILSLFLNNAGLAAAFRMEHVSTYSSIIFFGFLYSPISTLLAIVFNIFSRRHEYEADAYAVRTLGCPEDLISALKKLSKANLVNLTPHPLDVFVNYSHPPVLDRIRAIRELAAGA